MLIPSWPWPHVRAVDLLVFWAVLHRLTDASHIHAYKRHPNRLETESFQAGSVKAGHVRLPSKKSCACGLRLSALRFVALSEVPRFLTPFVEVRGPQLVC